VQYATFSKSLNPRNIDKTVSDIRIRIRFPHQFLYIRIRLQTHYPAGYPTGKPVSSEISDFTPCEHAQSNILHIKYAETTDN